MEYRPLKVNVISAQGIKNASLFSTMDVYAEVLIAGYLQSKQKTFVDKDSGPNPNWNHRMEFVVDEPYLTKPGLSLQFLLKAKRSIRGDKEIGSVIVPIQDLFQENSTGEERIVEYQVRRSSGKPKGSLKISYSFGEKFTRQAETKNHSDPMGAAYPKPNKHPEEPVTAYPAPAQYPGTGYPPAANNAYPAQPSGYGYQAPPPGYGYPPQQGYGYPPQAGYGAYPPVQKPKKNKMGMGGLGMGLGAGLLGGLLVGDMIGDSMGDMDGGFDF